MRGQNKKAATLAGVTASDTAVTCSKYNPAIGFVQTMSSREIADLVESRHDSVKRAIERLVNQGVIVQPPLVDEPSEDTMGRPRITQAYVFAGDQGKRDSIIVVAQLSPLFTARLVDRWQELEQKVTPAMVDFNDPMLLRNLLLAYTGHVSALQSSVSETAPQVAFAEAISNSTGLTKIAPFAKVIGWGPNRFFTQLREDKLLMANNEPYQAYIDRGYFKVVEKAPYTDSHGGEHPTFTTMVTGRGQEYLAKRYGAAGKDAETC